MRAFWANSTALRLRLPGGGFAGYPGRGAPPVQWPGRWPHRSPLLRQLATMGDAFAGSEKPAAGKRSSRLMTLEAILFAATESLSLESIAAISGLVRDDLEPLLGELQKAFDEEESALTISRQGGGYRLVTRPEFHPWLVRAGLAAEAPPLAEPLAEALAVVAYRQPVTRAEIDELRGSPSADLIRQLLERRLIRLAGRQKTLGRPAVYRTTRQFLEWTGLGQLGDLPPVEGIERRENPANSASSAGSSAP